MSDTISHFSISLLRSYFLLTSIVVSQLVLCMADREALHKELGNSTFTSRVRFSVSEPPRWEDTGKFILSLN